MVASDNEMSVKKTQVESEVRGIPKETLDFFGGDEIRARVFYEKYTLKDESRTVLEKLPTEMWERIAKAMAGVEFDDARRSEWTRSSCGSSRTSGSSQGAG